jgi:hypothetical protein
VWLRYRQTTSGLPPNCKLAGYFKEIEVLFNKVNAIIGEITDAILLTYRYLRDVRIFA